LLIIGEGHAHAFKELLIQHSYEVLLCYFLMLIPYLRISQEVWECKTFQFLCSITKMGISQAHFNSKLVKESTLKTIHMF
jgi:hypothetical protein